jgi:hypothetical protein
MSGLRDGQTPIACLHFYYYLAYREPCPSEVAYEMCVQELSGNHPVFCVFVDAACYDGRSGARAEVH